MENFQERHGDDQNAVTSVCTNLLDYLTTHVPLSPSISFVLSAHYETSPPPSVIQTIVQEGHQYWSEYKQVPSAFYW